MPLDPQARAYLDNLQAMGVPPSHKLSVQAVRELALAAINPNAPVTPVAKAENRTFPGPAGDIPVRIYTPEGSAPFLVVIYFHGGGWIMGNLDTSDAVTRKLCKGAGCVVVSV